MVMVDEPICAHSRNELYFCMLTFERIISLHTAALFMI